VSTDEERLEKMLDDGNHIKAKPRGVEQRFGTLRVLAGLWVLVGLAPWVCVGWVYINLPRLKVTPEITISTAIALGMVATATTLGGLALSELLQLAVSVEHTLRVIAARLKRSEP